MVKKYLPSTLVCLQDTQQTSEGHPKKIVQSHVFAGNFAEQLRARVASKCPNEFGEHFRTRFIWERLRVLLNM